MPDLIDFMEAEAARDAAMASVAANAEESCPGFADRAADFVLAFLADGPASGESITDACIAAGIVPHDQRAFGGVYMRLSRRNLIEKAGTCPRRKGHGTSGGVLWRLAQ